MNPNSWLFWTQEALINNEVITQQRSQWRSQSQINSMVTINGYVVIFNFQNSGSKKNNKKSGDDTSIPLPVSQETPSLVASLSHPTPHIAPHTVITGRTWIKAAIPIEV